MRPKFLYALMLIFGLALFTLCYWYTHFYQNPNTILLRSLSHINSIEAFSYTGNFHLTYALPSEKQTIVQRPVSFSSGFVGSYIKHKEADPRIAFSGTVNAGERTLAEFETKIIEKNVYVLIRSLADIGFIDNTTVINQWIFLDMSTLPPQISNLFMLPIWRIDTSTIKSDLDQSPITISHVFPVEVQDTRPVYHFQYHIDPERLSTVFPEIQNDFSKVEFGDGEIWIDSKTEYIRGISFSLKRKELERDAPQITITGIFHFDTTTVPSSIDPPSAFVPFQNLIQNSLKNR